MIPFSDEELLPVVEKSLEKIKPMLALDGGGLTLLGIKSGRVFCSTSRCLPRVCIQWTNTQIRRRAPIKN